VFRDSFKQAACAKEFDMFHPRLRSSTAFLLLAIVSATLLTDGCKRSRDKGQTASNESTQAQAAPLSIDDLVAPIALYPDQLLAQVLTASTNPQEVLDGGNWILQNQDLKGDALVSAAKAAGFGPSMQYLVTFPQVVDNMCQEMEWTTELGQTFQSDQQGVMEAVQRKRTQAQLMGNLSSSPQMTVANKTENGQQYVEIKPTDPKVVYVPQYNAVTIYNTPPPAPAPAPTTATTQKSGVSTGTAVGIGVMSFGMGMLVASVIHNNNHYYPYPAWGYHGVHYGGHPYYPPPYHPSYPGYHPANGYHPPPNYHWNQYNKNVNVNINNNYYNQFNNKNYSRTTYSNNRPVGATGVNQVTSAGRGANTYAGARPVPNSQKPGASMATAVPRNQQYATRASQPTNINHPSTSAAASNYTKASGSASRSSAGSYTKSTGSMDRGYANTSRPSTGTPGTQAARTSPSPQMQGTGASTGAFGGGNAQAERTASNRGRSSMSSAGGRRSR
jgi:hypothetical protein